MISVVIPFLNEGALVTKLQGRACRSLICAGDDKGISFLIIWLTEIYMILNHLKKLSIPNWKLIVAIVTAVSIALSVSGNGFTLLAFVSITLLVVFILKPFLLKHIVSTKLCLVKVWARHL